MSNDVAALVPGALNPEAHAWQPGARNQQGQGAGQSAARANGGGRGGGGGGRRGRNRNGPPQNSAERPAGPAAPEAGTSSGRGRGRQRNRNGRAQDAQRANGQQAQAPAPAPPAAEAAPAPGPSRRQKFGMKLTAGESSAPAPKETSAFPLRDDYPDLRTRLLAELSHGKYDCVICYSVVATRQPVWSCSQCAAVLHLSCAKQWAERSVKQMEEQNAMQEDPEIRARRGTWRCPSCQYAREDVPQRYWCWCGRVTDPSPQNAPAGAPRIPHSCGQQCSKGSCVHGCSDICHPAACPPCPVTVSRRCFCEKKVVTIRCSQLTRTSRAAMLEGGAADELAGISCTQTCGRPLACGKHTCAATCHAGACAPCAVTTREKCYCGRDEKEMRCGEGAARASERDGAQWEGRYACEQPCGRLFDCGEHACEKPCHPLDAQPAECPRSPALIKTCPCGATPATDRTKCTDPIPTCSNTCNKILPCGHACQETCHAGACKPCAIPITRPCRCGETKQTRMCAAAQSEGEEVLCRTVCKALRTCGKHQCNRVCCPLYFQAKSKSKKRPSAAELELQDPLGFHACDVPCGKPLGCRLHTCERSCHRGPCGRCLQSSFEELVCHCGRTVMEPPIQCGVQLKCNFPCTRPPPACGHPALPHNCHEEEACPPCVFLTDRLCHCKKTVVPNVPCSRANVLCGVQCGSVLGCGFHRCQGVCHQAPGDCPPCTQMCGKPRKLCGHACPAPCHAPSACPESEPCQAVTVLQCACGNIQQKVKCGVSLSNPRAERALRCNDSCAIAQRNAKMAEALGLHGEQKGPTQYPESVLAFYNAHRKEAEQVEQQLTEFVQSPRHGTILPVAKADVRKFTHELAAVFGLTSESVDEDPRRSVMVRRGGGVAVPTRTLNAAWKERAAEAALTANGPRSKGITLTQMRRQPSAPTPAAPSWNAFILEGVFGFDEQALRDALAPALGTAAYSLKWTTHEEVLVYPAIRAAMGTAAIDAAGRALATSLEAVRAACRSSSAAREVRPAAVDLSSPSLPVLRKGPAFAENRTATASAWSSHVLADHASAIRSAPGSGRATPTSTGSGAWGSGRLTAAAQAQGATSSGLSPHLLNIRLGAHRSAPSASPPVPVDDSPVPDSWDDSIDNL